MTYRMTPEAMREAIARAGFEWDLCRVVRRVTDRNGWPELELVATDDEAFCRTVPCSCGCGLTIWECSESKAKEGGQ